MSIQVGPHNLVSTRLILGADGNGTLKEDGPNFYQELDTDFGDFSGHILFTEHGFDEPWPTWEVHPHGDEFVYLLEGDTDFILRLDGVDKVVRMSRPGDYVMVPKGAWHTARPHTATRMLFVTPGQGTLNEVSPPE